MAKRKPKLGDVRKKGQDFDLGVWRVFVFVGGHWGLLMVRKGKPNLSRLGRMLKNIIREARETSDE